jgi:hypothetical protein
VCAGKGKILEHCLAQARLLVWWAVRPKVRGVSSRDRSWGANGRADSRASGSGLLSLEWFQSQAEKHAAATPLNYFAGNFIKIHRTLRMSPAMAAGVTDRLGGRGGLGSPLGVFRAEGRKSGINEPMGISNRVYRSVRVSPRSQAGDYSDAKYARSRRLGGRY